MERTNKIIVAFAFAVVGALWSVPQSGAQLIGEEPQEFMGETLTDAPLPKLQVEFRAQKDFFIIGEAMTFQAIASRPVYLYLFNAADEGDVVTMLFPNRYEKLNYIRANTKVSFPSSKSALRSDQAGIERVFLVASERKLNATSLKELVDDAEPALLGDAPKNIRIDRLEYRPLQTGVVIKKLDVLITEE
jgi:Domain of unknown function (DUF4384)